MKKSVAFAFKKDETISKQILWEELKKDFPLMSQRIKIIHAFTRASLKEKEQKR